MPSYQAWNHLPQALDPGKGLSSLGVSFCLRTALPKRGSLLLRSGSLAEKEKQMSHLPSPKDSPAPLTICHLGKVKFKSRRWQLSLF